MPIRTSTRAPSPSNRCEGRATCRHLSSPGRFSCMQRRFRGRYVFFKRLPSAEGVELFRKHKAAMVRSMEATLKDPSGSGLLWSNTSGACRPQHGCMPAPLPESLAAALYQLPASFFFLSAESTLLLASAPEIGYGFQDDEVKSGAVLYSSVLFWNASRLMAEMADAAGDTALAVSNSTTDNVIPIQHASRLQCKLASWLQAQDIDAGRHR